VTSICYDFLELSSFLRFVLRRGFLPGMATFKTAGGKENKSGPDSLPGPRFSELLVLLALF
jgi:hypothetical protein